VSTFAIVAMFGALATACVATSGAADSNANRTAARAEAPRLLSSIALPAGVTSVRDEPTGDGGALAQPGFDMATPNLVDAWGWWTTSLRPDDVLAYVRQHLPSGAHLVVSSSAGDAFSFGPTPGVLSDRVIAVTVAPLTGGGTGVRTDGEAVWLTARPSWEQIPAGVRSVTFTARGQTASGRTGRWSAPRTVTGAAAQQLVSLVNGLQVVQPGVSACPGEVNDVLRLTFRSATGAPVASAEEHPTGCAYVSLTIGGRAGPQLTDRPSVTSALMHLGAIPVCAGRQLRAAVGPPGDAPTGRAATLTFTNRSTAVCRLAGAPHLRLFDTRGRRVAARVHLASGAERLALDPGQAASTYMTWAPCGAARVARVRITLPGVHPSFSLAVGSRRKPFAPCHGRVTVGPLLPTF
jgi:hypothetical protein